VSTVLHLLCLFVKYNRTAGRLEEALIQYKRSEERGVERATIHIRNVGFELLALGILEVHFYLRFQVSAKILGQKTKHIEDTGES
jgi:hypothetical protein